jgi:hypothetical protein
MLKVIKSKVSSLIHSRYTQDATRSIGTSISSCYKAAKSLKKEGFTSSRTGGTRTTSSQSSSIAVQQQEIG